MGHGSVRGVGSFRRAVRCSRLAATNVINPTACLANATRLVRCFHVAIRDPRRYPMR